MKAATLSNQEKSYTYWFKKNWYYHHYCKALYRFLIPAGSRVLQIQCKTGELLDAVQPSYGVGIDMDGQSILYAQDSFPTYRFMCGTLDKLAIESFDYIILSSATMEVDDVQTLLTSLQNFCHERTRLIIDTYNFLWEPFLWGAQYLGLRRSTSFKNWLNAHDLKSFLYLANYEVITRSRHLLFPCYIPLISWFINTFLASMPGINALCLLDIVVARLQPTSIKKDYSVSVIIPCKNEKGNIENAVKRCPSMGLSTELIFIDGHSQDGTFQEIERVAQHYEQGDKKIAYVVQQGKGKGDAVRLGFSMASGEILMILDSDLTMPPEELPKYYNALVELKGDFINGSRLVYGMEDEAMRFLNLCANYLFGVGFTWLLGQPIKDTLCGTKVLFKKDYQLIEKNRSFFGDFDPFGDFDLLFGAAKQNLKIIEIPIHYKNRTYGQSQISRFKAGFLLLAMSWVAFKRFKCIKVEKR